MGPPNNLGADKVDGLSLLQLSKRVTFDIFYKVNVAGHGNVKHKCLEIPAQMYTIDRCGQQETTMVL